MEHPFVVGGAFENRKGPYTVLSISSSTMQVRYADGSVSTVNIDIQQRIWDRMREESTAVTAVTAVTTEKVRQTANPRTQMTTFAGLEEGDFKDNVAGTTWRGRGSLGGLVGQELSDMSGVRFVSLAIYRRPQFYVYRPELSIGRQEEGVRLPKFIVKLDSETLSYGFYIEKSDKAMGSEWYWPRFLNLLSDKAMQQAIEKIMVEQKLNWVLRFEKCEACEAFVKIIRPPFGEGSEFASFATFLAYLHSLPTQQWCNLYIETEMAKAEALELRNRVSRPIVTTLHALVPMYQGLLMLRI